jgi:hypothetical protein
MDAQTRLPADGRRSVKFRTPRPAPGMITFGFDTQYHHTNQ